AAGTRLSKRLRNRRLAAAGNGSRPERRRLPLYISMMGGDVAPLPTFGCSLNGEHCATPLVSTGRGAHLGPAELRVDRFFDRSWQIGDRQDRADMIYVRWWTPSSSFAR